MIRRPWDWSTEITSSEWSTGNRNFRNRLQNACFEGIPAKQRPIVWPKLIGNKLRITNDLFEILCAQVQLDNLETQSTGTMMTMDESDDGKPDDLEFADEELHDETLFSRKSSTCLQIEVDLSRTFPELAFFSEEESPMREWLRDILEAYSRFRPNISYVQGMSHIAALLLLFMDRDLSFICFCNVLHDHRFFGLVRMHDGSKIRRYFGFFDELLKEQVPIVHSHFERLGITPDMYLVDWLLTILAKPLPLDVAARVWDCYIFYDTAQRRERFLLRAIMGLLKHFTLQFKLLDFDSALTLLQNIPPTLNVNRYFQCISALSITASRYEALIQSSECG